MTDLIIRGATVVDGLGNDPIRADVAVKDGKIADIGNIKASGARTIDAGGLTLARASSNVHALRRAGDVGCHALALAVARRHHRGDGQLRLRHRAGDAGRPRPGDPQPLGGRGHGPRCAAHRHQLGLRELLRLHGDAASPRPLRQRRGAGRPFDHPHRRDGRGGVAAQGRDARGARQDEGNGGRRDVANGAIGLGASYSLNHSGYGGVPMPSTIAPMEELDVRWSARMGPRGAGA